MLFGTYLSLPSGSLLTVPFEGWVKLATLRLSPSTSESLARTSISAFVSSSMVAESLFATGSSLSGLTVMVKDWVALSSAPPFAVPPSSWIFSVIVAVPFLFAAGE